MDQLLGEAFTNALTGAYILGIISFVVPFIIFCLWLYFGIGTLTRLTDIKYKLDDILDALKANKNPDSEMVSGVIPKTEETSSAKPLAVNLKKEIMSLRMPTKRFVFTIAGLLVISTAMILTIFLLTE